MTDVEKKDDLNLDEVKEEVVEEVVKEEVVEEVVEETAEPEAAEQLFCKKCGAALEAGQDFCPKCGKRVATIEKEDVVAAVSKVGDSLKGTLKILKQRLLRERKRLLLSQQLLLF